MRQWMMNNPFFARIFLFNALLVLLVTLVSQAVVLQYVLPAYQEEIETYNVQSATHLRSTIDQQLINEMLRTVNRSFTDFYTYNEAFYEATNDVRGNTKALLDAIRKLDQIKRELPFAHSVDLYYPRTKLLLFDSRFCYMDNEGCSPAIQASWKSILQKAKDNVMWFPPSATSSSEEGRYVTYLRSIPYSAPIDKRQAVIRIQIDVQLIGKMLQQMKPNTDGMLLIVNEDGDILAHNQNNSLDLHGLSTSPAIRQAVRNAEKDEFAANWHGESYMISMNKSEYNQWRYLSLAPRDVLYEKVNRLRTILYALGGLVVLAGILGSYVLTRKIHKPINRAIRTYSNTITHLNETIDANKAVIRHHYIWGLLQGEQQVNTSITQQALIGSALQGGYVTGFNIEYPLKSNPQFESEMVQVYRLIEELEQAPSEGQVWAVRGQSGYIHGFIYTENAAPMREAIQQVSLLLAAWAQQEQAGVQAVLGIGTTKEMEEGAIAATFQEAQEAAKYSYLYEDRTPLAYEDLDVANRGQIQSDRALRLLNELEQGIRVADERALLRLIDTVVEDIRIEHYTVSYVKHLLFDMVSTLRKTLQSLGFSTSAMFGSDIREQFRALRGLRAVQEWMGKLVSVAIAHMEERRRSSESDLQVKIRSAIEESTFRELSLEHIASQVGISSAYLSRVFRASSGMTFTEYVTDRKLQAALHLIEEKKLSVLEIAAELGYNSPNHFIRIFKERYGQTPKQYQRGCEPGGTRSEQMEDTATVKNPPA
ncbi:AraC family transcriptional regulator [Paenibacillus sp. GCM10023252]|uniref:AraC family transcriptional regulator n=1 Tax=Paenibacillus sp. GCM10023252 TaxID=3252649 RepID=UPI0036228CF7